MNIKMKKIGNQDSKTKNHDKSSLLFNNDTIHDVIINNYKKTRSRQSPISGVISQSLQPAIIYHLSNNRKYITRHTSSINIMTSNIRKLNLKRQTRSCNAFQSIKCSNVIISPAFRHRKETHFKVYRCQITQNEVQNCDNCCCSCNSDTLFEVMKDLYDCYKNKNCDKCNCILCCHLPKEERYAQLQKPKISIDLDTALREIAKKGFLLPEAKTVSEKQLLDKIRLDLGLPPEPNTRSMREKYTNAAKSGIMLPLEGKSPKQKEKILEGLNNNGIPLPEGRTPSEKSLVNKIQAKNMAPMEASTMDPRENLLRDLAMQGVFLPEGTTLSLKKVIDKVRLDLGLPPEPKTSAMKNKYKDAVCDGIFLPLEGKSATEKEKILQDLHDRSIILPQGRTRSEKALIDKIKAKPIKTLKPAVDKSPSQVEKIMKKLTKRGALAPEDTTTSEKALITKLRKDLGLPPEPKTSAMRHKYAQAAEAGLIQPLEGKSPNEKANILNVLKKMGLPLPEGRTSSEEALIHQIKTQSVASLITKLSERQRRAKAEGVLTPLEGKTASQKEKILTGLAKHGIPLPEGTTPSDKTLINKIRHTLGLPPEPKTPSMKEKHAKAANAGLLQALEGKSSKEKTKMLKALQNMGIPLPEGRTPSEKALIQQIKARTPTPSVAGLSEKMRRAIAAGLLTPLEGKSLAQKEKILTDLAKRGIPLPEGKTTSENNLLKIIRRDLGLPHQPKTASMKDKQKQAADAGLLYPLKGKSPKEKERMLRGLHKLGIPLPEAQTPSEKALINKINEEPQVPLILSPSEKIRRAKTAGLLTPFEGKTPSQKEKILTGLASLGITLPEAKSTSDKNLIMKIRHGLGLPPEPTSASMKEKHAKAADAGLLQALEGKSPNEKNNILVNLHNMGIPLPEGRTPSEKALIEQIKARSRAPSVTGLSEKLRRAKAAGLLTPLKGKSLAQKEKILTDMAKRGLPLPEAKTASEKNLLKKVRRDVGLPSEPKTASVRNKHKQAAAAGLLYPLQGKSPKEKERILRGLHNLGIPLPEARTPSEKALINKINEEPRSPSTVSFSERKRRAKAAGLLTPLKGKTPAEKEKILTGLARLGIAMPEGTTPSENKIISKIGNNLGLPPAPKTASMKDKYAKAAEAGVLKPLEGKSPQEKANILINLQNLGIPLPEGRTLSEKALIQQIKARSHAPSVAGLSERMRRAKAAGLLTPLEGKTPAQKEKILTELAKHGIPLPEGKTPSEQKIIINIGNNLGLPPAPKSASMKEKYAKAAAAGLLQPLKGKSPKEKKDILINLQNMGIPLPDGRTPSEKALINDIKARPRDFSAEGLSEKMREAKAAGFITPLEGKTASQKEKILTGLAKHGLPLPEGKTPSDKKLISKIIKQPPERKSLSMKEKYAKPIEAALLPILKGKSPKEKANILSDLHNIGLPLPEGRTPSEKALVAKVKATPKTNTIKSPKEMQKILSNLAKAGLPLPEGITSSQKAMIKQINKVHGIPEKTSEEKLRRAKKDTIKSRTMLKTTPSQKIAAAKAAGLFTPLEGKSEAQMEKILEGLAKIGLPLPEAKTLLEKNIIRKIHGKMGLPPVPETSSLKDKYKLAYDAGIITPLEGKTATQKENILNNLLNAGIPLPTGRTDSEKAMIKKIKTGSLKSRFDKMSPTEKESFLKKQLKSGKSLPEVTTPSDAKLFKMIINEMGLPPEPKTPSLKDKMKKARVAGLITPLEGKSSKQKEKILKSLVDAGIPLPTGRTPSEKAMINKFRAQKPLEGLSPDQKEATLKRLAVQHLPLPEGSSPSENLLIAKVRKDLGLPPKPETASMKERMHKAHTAGLITPLEGKSPSQKEKHLKGLSDAGIPLPEGRTLSEKAMINKIKKLEPLEGKSPKEREEILGKLAAHGLPLPKGVTPSEKSLIIKKTGKCSRACGCDKKKIKFKHSYVKIKVTSPDVSNLCVCPEECIPRVKGGVFLDDVINVVIEAAIGVPNYCIGHKTTKPTSNLHNSGKTYHSLKTELSHQIEVLFENKKNSKLENIDNQCTPETNIQNRSLDYFMYPPFLRSLLRDENTFNTEPIHMAVNKYSKQKISFISINYKICDQADYISSGSSHDSIASVLFIESESSLGFTSCEFGSNSSNTYRKMVFISNSDAYLESLLRSKIHLSDISVNTTDLLSDILDDCVIPVTSDSNDFSYTSAVTHETKKNRVYTTNRHHDNIFKVFQTELINMHEMNYTDKINTKTEESVIVINELNSELDIARVVNNLLSNEEFGDVSSLFVVVSTSDDEDDEITLNNFNSATCNQLSKNYQKRNISKDLIFTLPYERRTSNTSGLKVSAKGKRFLLEGAPTCAVKETCPLKATYAIISENTKIDKQNEFNYCPPRNITSTKNKRCQIITPDLVINNSTHVVSTDTTQDRPCCCPVPQDHSTTEFPPVPYAHWSADLQPIYNEAPHITNVVSELITPVFSGQGSSDCCSVNTAGCCSAKSSCPSLVRPLPPCSPCSPCGIRPICSGHSGCTIPSNILDGVARGPHWPPPLAELKKLLEQPCKCTPEQMAKIFQHVIAKTQKSTRDTGTCGSPCPMAHPQYGPTSPSPSQAPCRMELKSETRSTCDLQPEPRPSCMSQLKVRPTGIHQHQPLGDNQLKVQSCCDNTPKGCPSCDSQPKVRSCCDNQSKVCPSFACQTDCMQPACPTAKERLKRTIGLKKKIAKAKKNSKKKSHSAQVKCSDSCLYQNPYIPNIGQTTPSTFNTGFTDSISIQVGPGCAVCPSGLPCSSPHTTCPKTMIRAKKLPPTKVIPGKSSQSKLNREMVLIEIIGPLGGLSEIGSNGTLTQAGLIQIRRNNAAYAGEQLVGPLPPTKKGKCKKASTPKIKKSKVTCGCPPWEPEPEDFSPIDYDQLRKNLVFMKSDLTQTVSGFKVLKPKAPPEQYWGVEDSIKYYASVNPKFISELVPPRIVVKPHKSDCACYDPKYNSGGSEWPDWPEPDGRGTLSEPPREEPFTGFRIRMDGKGSGSKGLQGICCFDMIQDR